MNTPVDPPVNGSLCPSLTRACTRIFILLYAANLLIDLAVGFIFRFRTSRFALEADKREYYEIVRSMLSGTKCAHSAAIAGLPAAGSGYGCCHCSSAGLP